MGETARALGQRDYLAGLRQVPSFGLSEDVLAGIRGVNERMADVTSRFADIHLQLESPFARLSEAAKSIGLMGNIIQFPKVAGFEFNGAPSAAPAIIRPSKEDVRNVERGKPIRNKGGRPSYDKRYYPLLEVAVSLSRSRKADGPYGIARLMVEVFGYGTDEAKWEASGRLMVWGSSDRAARDSFARFLIGQGF